MYALGSTAAAQLIRRNRKLKLCQTAPELFVSLSLLLLALAGSACTECGTCMVGLCLEGSLGWDMSPLACVQSCFVLLLAQGIVESHPFCPCHAPASSVSLC